MNLKVLNRDFSVCKVKNLVDIDFSDEFVFVGKTDEELSLVCSTEKAPIHCIERDDSWSAFRIEGVLDFSLVGILAKISSLLAENSISIFAVSTYNTDYILIKKDKFECAVKVLTAAGYVFK